jgi:hypothetical protein
MGCVDFPGRAFRGFAVDAFSSRAAKLLLVAVTITTVNNRVTKKKL